MALPCEPCAVASKDNKATFKCTECEEIYCDKCADDHAKFRAFRHHCVIPLEPPVGNKTAPTVVMKSEGQTEAKGGSGDVGPVKNANAAQAYNLAVDIEKTLNIRSKADAEGNAIYSESADLDAERKALYSGSSDLDVEDKQLYCGSDDLDAQQKTIYCGSDNLAEDTAAINENSDVLKEKHVYNEIDDTSQSTGHFYIDVNDSDFSRSIGIANSRCMLIVSEDTETINVSKNGVIKFECSIRVIRRCVSLSTHELFHIEFGRGFQYGSGILTFNIKNRKELKMLFSDIMTKPRVIITHM